ncbi:uncharacterized protein LOC143912294 [Arctopsyche grandis]|uniref:uncharacterized protein LOC143912294 n=1 Tax=Arctopsyche grandis TaxID=121162 RepID=UPI00406D9467
MDCLKRKVIVKLENEMNNNRTLEISDGIYLKRDPDAVHENSVMGSKRYLSTGVSEARGSVLNSLLMSRVLDYLKTSVVQFKLADSVDEARRKKGGKGGAMFMYMAMGLATVLGQVFLGKIALISGAALMIAKISLLLALLTAVKKLSGGGGGGGGGEHVVYAAKDEHGGGWQRSGMAQEMAYRAHLSRQKKSDSFVPNPAYNNYYQGERGEEVS